MTWFSLKRTLQSNLASSIDVLNPINPSISGSNLYTPLRYSAISLSIGKTTQICHQNIPLKKVYSNETITYVSAISRKLASIWQQPSDKIADRLLSVLNSTESIWSDTQKLEDGWLAFTISQQGIAQWQQHLNQLPLPSIKQTHPWPIKPQMLWQLQSGYELCCRWQARYPQIETLCPPTSAGPATFLMPSQPPLQTLIHCLLDICDSWHQSKPSQLLQQTKQLVLAVEACSCLPELTSDNWTISPWLASTHRVVKQSLSARLGHQLAEQF